jgi:hypothetical protein
MIQLKKISALSMELYSPKQTGLLESLTHPRNQQKGQISSPQNLS